MPFPTSQIQSIYFDGFCPDCRMQRNRSFHLRCRGDGDFGQGHIPLSIDNASGHGRDGVNHFHALNNFTKNGVTRIALILIVQRQVIDQVHKKLGRGRIRLWGAGHGQGAAHIGQPVLALENNRLCLPRLFVQARGIMKWTPILGQVFKWDTV